MEENEKFIWRLFDLENRDESILIAPFGNMDYEKYRAKSKVIECAGQFLETFSTCLKESKLIKIKPLLAANYLYEF